MRVESFKNKMGFCLLLITLLGKPSLSQVLNLDHAGKIENGFGANLPLLNFPNDVFVQGNIAYVSSFTGNALVVFDITLPAAPVQIASVIDGQGGALLNLPQKVVVSGHYAYLTSLNVGGSLEIIDIADPVHPAHAGSLSNGVGGALLNNPANLFVSGNYVYVVNLDGTGKGSLEIIDVTNPANPKHVSKLVDGGGLTAPYLSGASAIFVSGNYAYIGNTDKGGLEIIDISKPLLPVHKGYLADGGGVAPYLKQVYAVAVSGNYAYVVDFWNSALEVVNVSNPAIPVHAGSLYDNGSSNPPLISSGWSINISGKYAYMTSPDWNSLEIADISNPTNPTHVGYLKDGQGGASLVSPRSVFVSNNRAYVVNNTGNSFEVVDVSTPQAPVHLASLFDGGGGAKIGVSRSVFIVKNYAYISTEGDAPIDNLSFGAFEILDISNPSKPAHLSSLSDGGGSAPFLAGARSVYVSNQYAYLVNIAGYLEIIDVTNGTAPFHVGSLNLGFQGASAVEVHGNLAYIAGLNKFVIVDVSNPSSPLLKGSLADGAGVAPYLSSCRSLKVVGNYAYVVGAKALEVIDITNPLAPAHYGSLLDGGGVAPFIANTRSVFLSGKYAYITSIDRNSLEIVDISNPASPAHVGSLIDGKGGALMQAPEIVVVIGKYAFVTLALSNAVEVVDISDPINPVHYTSIKDGTHGALLKAPDGLAISSNFAYVTGLSGGMEVLELYAPAVTSINPSTGSVGTQVTINGKNFNQTLAVSFDGVVASTPQSITASSAVVTVPPGATLGAISVNVNGLSSSSSGTFLVIPSALQARNVQPTGFTASWSDVGATTYYIDVSTDNFATYVSVYNNLNIGNTTSFAVTGLLPGTNYQYRVRSSDGAGNSGNSNYIAIVTLPTTPTANAATQITQSGFTANWTFSPGASGYSIDVAYDYAFSNFVVGYNNLSVPNAAAITQIVTGLNSYTTCYYRVRSVSASGSSTSSNVIKVITLDIIPPAISPSGTSNPSAVTLGNTPFLNTVITDNVSVDSAQLFYRGIAQRSFKKVNMQGPGGTGGSYSITVQTNWYDSLGMEYYFKAIDEAGNTTVTNSSYIQLITPSLALPALPSGTSQSDYRIIAFPYQLATDNKVTTVYSGVPWNDNTKAAMWWWNSSTQNGHGSYDQYGSANAFQTVDQGKGYWAITSTSITPQLANVPAPKYNRSNLYSMTLKPNWNEVGNPYPVAISWDDVIAFNQKNNITSFSSLSIFDGTGYKTVTGNVLLKPFQGGFVKNLSSSDITIQIPFQGETTPGGRIEAIGPDLSQEAWKVFLYIKQNDFINQLGGFGMHPLAKSGPDYLDNFNPPQFMNNPEINFKNKDYSGSSFSFDMVTSQENYRWQFTPNGQQGDLAQLVWDQNLKTSGKQLFLLDEQSVNVVDMSQVSTYDFALNKANHFSIFYGTNIENKVVLPEIAASAPYPNPLNNDAEVSINLSLPDSNYTYPITLQIFNGQGELIGNTNTNLPSGIHPLKYSLADKSLASGIYFFKLSVAAERSSGMFTGKIVKP